MRRINPNTQAKLKYIIADLSDSKMGADVISVSF